MALVFLENMNFIASSFYLQTQESIRVTSFWSLAEEDEFVSSSKILSQLHEKIHINVVDVSPFQVHISEYIVVADGLCCK